MRKLILLLTLSCLGAQVALAHESHAPNELDLVFMDESKSLTLEDLEIYTVEEKYSGSEKSWLADLFAFGKPKVKFFYDTERTERKIRELWESPQPKNAHWTFENDVLVLNAEVNGVNFDAEELIENIKKDYPKLKEYTVESQSIDLLQSSELEHLTGQVSSLLNPGLEIVLDGKTHFFPAQLKDIKTLKGEEKAYVELDAPFATYVMNTLEQMTNDTHQDLTILEAGPDMKRAITEGRVKQGATLMSAASLEIISAAVKSGQTKAEVISQSRKGQIVNASGFDMGELELIAQGISNFRGSDEGRKANVRKALSEKLHGILIAPGEDFSFVASLDGPVTYSGGWAGAYAIFGGKNLVKVPGGGICQASTTIYRAALDAGLTVKRQQNHSMYVVYYGRESVRGVGVEGDGLDATIFPGSVDLVFTNNTANWIFVEAYHEGEDAIVNFYGTKDGRSTILEGPYTKSNQSEELVQKLGGLSHKQIAWKYLIHWPDGRIDEDWLISSYNTGVPQQ